MTATPAFPFACIILAAGAGTRFGMPKAQALIAPGVRFVDRVAERARETGADPVVVVLPAGVESPAGVRAVHGTPGAEQISSLRRGLAQLANRVLDGTLVWPVDHPYVELRSALAVIDVAKRGDAAIVIPTHGGRRGHPSWFRRDTWPDLMTAEQGGARSVIQSWTGQIREIDVPDAGVVRDINEPSLMD